MGIHRFHTLVRRIPRPVYFKMPSSASSGIRDADRRCRAPHVVGMSLGKDAPCTRLFSLIQKPVSAQWVHRFSLASDKFLTRFEGP